MWVRIKGVLYNLALVKSIDFKRGQFHVDTGEVLRNPELVLVHCDSFNRSGTGISYNSESTTISFNSLEDAKIAYNHIIKTIDIPQLKQEDFHDE